MPLSMREKHLLAERIDTSKKRYDELMTLGESKTSAVMITALEVGVSEAAIRRYLKIKNEEEKKL